jgi:hypothetical protein
MVMAVPSNIGQYAGNTSLLFPRLQFQTWEYR